MFSVLMRMLRKYRLQSISFALLILAPAFFATATSADNFAVGPTESHDWRRAYASEIVVMANQVRDLNDVGYLQEDAVLQKAAQMKAEDMASRSYFSHVTPEGKDPWYWLQKNDIDYAAAGENLAIKFEDPTKIVPAWMDSPKHKKNLLNANYTHTGVGVAKGQYEGREVVFVVELYIKPNNQKTIAGFLQKYL